jgi:hypothetical protein
MRLLPCAQERPTINAFALQRSMRKRNVNSVHIAAATSCPSRLAGRNRHCANARRATLAALAGQIEHPSAERSRGPLLRDWLRTRSGRESRARKSEEHCKSCRRRRQRTISQKLPSFQERALQVATCPKPQAPSPKPHAPSPKPQAPSLKATQTTRAADTRAASHSITVCAHARGKAPARRAPRDPRILSRAPAGPGRVAIPSTPARGDVLGSVTRTKLLFAAGRLLSGGTSAHRQEDEDNHHFRGGKCRLGNFAITV